MTELSVREMDLLCLYRADTRLDTLAMLCEAMPCIDAPDVLAVAKSAARKLAIMGDTDFSAIGFGAEPPYTAAENPVA